MFAKIQKLRAEEQLGIDANEEGSDSGTQARGSLRPDLLTDAHLARYHIVLKGANKTFLTPMHAAIPEFPPNVPKQEVFNHADLVMHSQVKYGTPVSTSLPDPPREPNDDDDFMIPRS
jgi:hypothetical protein